MGQWTKYFLFIFWLSYLFVCGVLLFTRGFLLSREALPNNSTCEPQADCYKLKQEWEAVPTRRNKKLYLDCLDRDQILLNPGIKHEFLCQKTQHRAIILLIDALKYDFTLYNSTLKDNERLPYQNQMPIFDELLKSLPNNSRLFKFVANPPTTTLQRLKGLTTGSLPTFIDAGMNFGTSEINEDNLLSQLLSHGKSIVTLGDDVWKGLFPNHSIREFVYPSFNIFDLDKVDRAVEKHLKREIYEKDWTLLIGHMLGVDHCGHAFGPNHKEMSRKLKEMNAVVR